MSALVFRFVPVVALAALAGCSGPALAPTLGAPETFAWNGQPIAFSPPGPEWRREAYLEGGMRGVRFVKERADGVAIWVADYYILSDRNRRSALSELNERLAALDDRDLRSALSRARWRTDEPMGRSETDVASAVNGSIDRAMTAAIQGDHFTTRSEIASALAATDRLDIPLDDVLEQVVFRPERHAEPNRYRLQSQQRVAIAGRPSVRVEYTVQTPERLCSGCEIYVMDNSHLFVADYIGTKPSMPLFDRVVASITFPEAETKP